MMCTIPSYVIVPGWDGSQEKDMSGAPLCLYQAGLAKAVGCANKWCVRTLWHYLKIQYRWQSHRATLVWTLLKSLRGMISYGWYIHYLRYMKMCQILHRCCGWDGFPEIILLVVKMSFEDMSFGGLKACRLRHVERHLSTWRRHVV